MKKDWDFVKVFRDLDDLTTTIYGHDTAKTFEAEKKPTRSSN